MIVDQEDIDRVARLALARKGTPYEIGGYATGGKYIVRGKPLLDDPEPASFDCSGFSRWVIGQISLPSARRLEIPHGCLAQLKFCRAMFKRPRVLDLGFADLSGNDGAPDHVVVKLNDSEVIEARGAPYFKVITRPISAWEQQRGFLGWWTVPGLYE